MNNKPYPLKNANNVRPKKGNIALIVIVIIIALTYFFSRASSDVMETSNQTQVLSDVQKTISKTTDSARNYGGGAGCTGISMANIRSNFDRSFTYNSSSKELTLPGGYMVATLDCTQAPKSSSTGPYRPLLTIRNVPDDICVKTVNSEMDRVDAIQTKSDSASSTITVKNYGDNEPSGMSLVGDTACAANSNSTIYIWIKNH